jgi:hypothetical protein
MPGGNVKFLTFVTLASALQSTVGYAASPGSAASEQGQDQPAAPATDVAADATLKLQGGSVAAGIGYVWGHGTVTYKGVDHKFHISGVSVVDVGAAKISATGEVSHLDKLADLAGVYTAWSAGATFGGGGSAVYMKNEHGVVIKLISTTEGLRFNLSGNGVKVKLSR